MILVRVKGSPSLHWVRNGLYPLTLCGRISLGPQQSLPTRPRCRRCESERRQLDALDHLTERTI